MTGEKNLPKAENQLRNSKPKIEAEKPKVKKADTLEEAVELCISMLIEYDTTEAEIANLVIKSLQKRNKKLMTTSNKKVVSFKVA